MKFWYCLGLAVVIGSPLAKAIPHEPFTVETMTGVVELAVWRSDIELNRVFATKIGEPQEEVIDTVPAHWAIILKDTKGVDDFQRTRLSWAYNRLPIDGTWRHYTRNLQKTHLYLLLSGPKNLPIKIGSTVKVHKISYAGMDFEGDYSFEKVEIDGKAVEIEGMEKRPSWRTVHKVIEDKPVPDSKAKPDDKVSPQQENKK